MFETFTKMLKTSMIDEIKAIRAIKKWPDEVSIYNFVKNENPSIDINVIENHD